MTAIGKNVWRKHPRCTRLGSQFMNHVFAGPMASATWVMLVRHHHGTYEVLHPIGYLFTAPWFVPFIHQVTSVVVQAN
jgi:hypothetical protein